MGFAAIQTLTGVTQLSELGIDVSKNWLGFLIKNLASPEDDQDAVTKAYLLALLDFYLPLTGGTLSGVLYMGGYPVSELDTPADDYDAATKKYVDDAVATVGGSNVIWKDEPDLALVLFDIDAFIDWTTLDLAAYTSADATLAILWLAMTLTSISSASRMLMDIRKTGTAPIFHPCLRAEYVSGDRAGATKEAFIICGLNGLQEIDYRFVPEGTIHIEAAAIYVLGYVE